MPKKRTVIPFYGKDNQNIEAVAARMAKIGTEESIKASNELMEKSRKLRLAKKSKLR